MNSTDLLITDDDLTLVSGDARPIKDRDCIAQDIKHMIREKGYAARMVGNRNNLEIAQLAQEIEIEMELDTRLVPGTAEVVNAGDGKFFAFADTVEFGRLEVRITS